jgi:hypothetical protein
VINGRALYGVLGVECTLVVGLDCELWALLQELIPLQNSRTLLLCLVCNHHLIYECLSCLQYVSQVDKILLGSTNNQLLQVASRG